MPSHHFDLLAPVYDRIVKYANPDKLISLLNIPAQGYLLDVAGGTGRAGYPLREYVSKVFVTDLSIKMLEQAAAKNNLEMICCSSEALPFQEQSCDRVVMVDSFHHVMDQASTAAELWRVIKVGGRIVIEEPDIGTWPVRLLALAEKVFLMRSHFVPAHTMSRMFPFPNARTWVENEGNTFWVVIDKMDEER